MSVPTAIPLMTVMGGHCRVRARSHQRACEIRSSGRQSPWKKARATARPAAEIQPLTPKVLALIDEGRSYRWIARDLAISKNTVADIAKRNRAGDE